MARNSVLLGDDHVILRDGLTHLLENDFDVVGAVADGRALVAEAERLRPDLIVFDIGMPLLNGMEAARQLRTVVPATKLVCLTQQSGREYVQAIFRLGGSAYVLKNEAASELIAALHESLKGRYYLSSELRKTLRDVSFDPRENPADLFGGRLTPRQREVLQLLAEGKSAKEIAHLLGISIKTVEFHKASISDELGIRTTAELTRYAVEQKIVTSSMQ